ncbi:MAG: hypothetical protein Q4E47_02085 [Candidatus Saccharibacteria bacterium]|nr:hypothetical protein [Candidatus Saccharibacteria bacterium]
MKNLFRRKITLDKAPRRKRNYFERKTVAIASIFVGIALLVGSVCTFSIMKNTGVFGAGEHSNYDPDCTGSGCDSDTDVKYTTCSGTPGRICYTDSKAVSGFSWIFIPISAHGGTFAYSSLPAILVKLTAPGVPAQVSGCEGANGVYLFARNLYRVGDKSKGVADAPYPYLAGPESTRNYNGNYQNFGYSWSDGSYEVDESEAKEAYEAAKQSGKLGSAYSWDNLSWFCAWGETPPPHTNDPFDCSDIVGLDNGTPNYGNTWGDAYVKNLTATDTMNRYSSNEGGGRLSNGWLDNYTFAKQGDSIQFRERLCSAAMKVSGTGITSLYENRDNDDGIGIWGGGSAKAFGQHNAGAVNVHFALSAQPGTGGISKFLFDTNAPHYGVESTPPTWYSANQNAQKGFDQVLTDLPSKDRHSWGFQIFSPSEAAGTEYKCDLEYTINNKNTFANPGYQVSGYASKDKISDCPKQEAPTRIYPDNNMIGKTITQRIFWNNIVGFEQLKGNDNISGACRYTGSECGRYDIVENTRRSTSWNRFTNTKDNPHAYNYGEYEDVKAAAGPWGWHKAGCSIPSCNYAGCCTYFTGQYGQTTDGHGNVTGTYPIYATTAEWDGSHGSCCVDQYIIDADPWYTPLYWYDQTAYQGKEYETDSATLYIPYNFSTSASAETIQSKVVYGGTGVKTNWAFSINPKANKYTSTFGYATITPSSTKVQVVEFILDENATTVRDGNRNASGVSSVCEYFGFSEGDSCRYMYKHNGSLNLTGDYAGERYTGSAVRTIPDTDVGKKYCVAIGIYPADSLNWQSATAALLKGIGMQGGNTWNITSPQCRTISKKPNFQVWNGGIYSPNSITTSVSKKIVGAKLDGSTEPQCTGLHPSLSDCTSYIASKSNTFGSWDGQLILSKNDVSGMASAAAFGYNGNNVTNSYNFALKGGNSSNANMSTISKLTVANSGSYGNAGGIRLTDSIITRLKARYMNLDSNTSTHKNTNVNGDGLEYWYYSGNATLGNIMRNTIAKRADGTYGDNTLVIQVNGNLTINGNICYGSAQCYSNSTVLNSYSDTRANSIAALPQILIFAKNITINDNVTRIDAWMITTGDGSTGTSAGTIKTCNIDKPSSEQCNQTLVVNGPLYAKTLLLKRTAGSLPGGGSYEGGSVLNQNLTNDGSITPGEIFNLRADAYLWAYNQAQRYSEAVVTYSRELAPRY